jgi:hypothetical protein
MLAGWCEGRSDQSRSTGNVSDRLALSRLCEDDARRKIATAQPAGRAPVAKGNFSQLTFVIFWGCYFARYHRTEVKTLSRKPPPE